MIQNILYISLAVGCAVFFLTISVGFILTDKSKGNLTDDNEGVLEHFSLRMFSALFSDKTPEEIAADMGIKPDEYYKNCRIAKENVDLVALVMHVIYGIAIGMILMGIGIFTNPLFIIIGLCVIYYIGYYPRTRLKNKVSKYRSELNNDLPGFMGLLKTELAIGLPMESAMMLIANKQDTRLAKELRLVARQAELGATGWAEGIEQLAADYDLETLKTFSMSVASANKKGVSVADTIERTYRDIRETHILNIEKDAASMTNYVMLPLVVFNLIPVIAFMMIPILLSLNSIY